MSEAAPSNPVDSGGRICRFVIFASPKSGTTWVQRMLSAHPEILCGETRPFGRYFDPANPSAPYITLESFISVISNHHPSSSAPAGDEMRDRMLFGAFEAMARASLESTGKSIYGEKITPARGTAQQVIERLSQYNRRIKFIHLNRDGRDVIVSGLVHQLRIRASRVSGEERDRYERLLDERALPDDELHAMSGVWADAVRAGLAGESIFENHLRVRYEELLARPEIELERMLKFVGVESELALVRDLVMSHTFERLSGGRAGGQEDRTSFFRKGVAGDWVQWFSPEQAQWFEQHCGELLARLGHSCSDTAEPSI